MRKLTSQVAVLMLAAGLAPAAMVGAEKKKAAPKRQVKPALLPFEDEEGLPRFLPIADSISIGYALAVKDLLKD